LRYFVIAPDGNKYGPADVATLQTWLAEGRLSLDTWLEAEGTGGRVQARAVLQPIGAQPGTYPPPGFSQPPGPGSPYPRSDTTQVGGNGNTQLVIGWVCAVLSLFCCPLGFGIAAIILGVVAKGKGHPKAQILVVCAVIMMILGMVIGFVVLGNDPNWQRLFEGM
jgi:hypothetical protein